MSSMPRSCSRSATGPLRPSVLRVTSRVGTARTVVPGTVPARDDAALRDADEFDERPYSRRREAGVLLDRAQRPARIQLRLQQVAIGAFELAHGIGREAPA